MEDFFRSIKAHLYERAASPLLGAFAISWMLWNYRILVIIFFGGSPAEKLDLIDAYLDSFLSISVLSPLGFYMELPVSSYVTVYFPVLTTILYIYALPFLSEAVYEHSLKAQKKLVAIKQEIEGSRLLTVEESRKIFSDIQEAEAEYDALQDRSSAQIRALKDEIGRLQSEIALVRSGKNAGNDGEKVLDDEQIKDLIARVVNNTPDHIGKKFAVEDLLGREEWESLSAGTRKQIGRLFKKGVDEGLYPLIVSTGKGSDNTERYRLDLEVGSKEFDDLSDNHKRILDVFNGNVVSEVNAEHLKRSLKMDLHEVSYLLQDLEEKGYLKDLGSMGRYALAKKGNLYVLHHKRNPKV